MKTFYPNLPVCLEDGRPAEIVHRNYNSEFYCGCTLLVVYETEDGENSCLRCDPETGTSAGIKPNLINQALFDGMKPNPGYRPDDWDRNRPVILANGHEYSTDHGSWTLTDTLSDIAFYWPKSGPETITMDLTPEELVTIKLALGRIAGSSAHSIRKYVDRVYNRIPVQTYKFAGSLFEEPSNAVFADNTRHDENFKAAVETVRKAYA